MEIGVSTSDFVYLLYILPGFLVYALIRRILPLERKMEAFEILILSLLLSLCIYAPISLLASFNLLSVQTPDWRLVIALLFFIILLFFISILAIKYLLPRLEKFTQRLDVIKTSPEDVFFEILKDKIQEQRNVGKTNGIWLAICTNENEIYSGYLRREGLFNSGRRGIYLKNVVQIEGSNKRFNIKESEGILFLDDKIKWISIVRDNYSH